MGYQEILKKRVIVVGGGFAGLNFIQHLWHHHSYKITLVDKNNYNLFTPLLYQVATSFLEPSSISYPFRKLFKDKDVTFRMAALDKVDALQNKIILDDQTDLSYDILVLAAGSKTNFFGNDAIRVNAFSLKGIDDALFMRNELIKVLEKAAIEKDAENRRKLLTLVIAGGGATGVEVAGMLAEMRRFIYVRDYPELKAYPCEIYIVDGSSNLLGPMSTRTHAAAYRALDELGVHMRLNNRVLKFENDQVYLSGGEIIAAKTLIWSAGVIANKFDGIPVESLGGGGRMLTDSCNRLRNFDNIYAIGDIAIQLEDPGYPAGHPQLAQPAIQQGKNLARNLIRLAEGKTMKPFIYADRGEMAVIGKNKAVADLFKHKLHFGGLAGLVSWLFIHLMSLVSVNNKIKTLYNWVVAYLTHDQSLRMIFRSENRENRL
jgi:NADH dehydrogenase